MALVLVRAPRNRRSPIVSVDAEGFRSLQASDATPETPSEEGSAAGSSEKATTPADSNWTVTAIIVAIVGIVAGWIIYERNIGPAFVANPELNEFALFYIFAQGLERVAEFVSYFPWVGARSATPETDNEKKTKEKAAQQRNEALSFTARALNAGNDAAADEQADKAAKNQHHLDVIRSNRAIFFFGLNTAIAALVVGYFHIALLKTAGVQSDTGVANLFDIIITSIAIGGGTKPLHDLITNIQKKKEQAEDAPATATA